MGLKDEVVLKLTLLSPECYRAPGTRNNFICVRTLVYAIYVSSF
jgi:hypothetical protein